MIDVRRLTSEDSEDYRTIRLAALQTCPEAFGSTYEAEAEWPLSHFAERIAASATFGAYVNSSIVGMAAFVVNAGPKERHKGMLVGTYVQSDARREGTGAALVRAVIDHGAGIVEQIVLTVVKGMTPR